MFNERDVSIHTSPIIHSGLKIDPTYTLYVWSSCEGSLKHVGHCVIAF